MSKQRDAVFKGEGPLPPLFHTGQRNKPRKRPSRPFQTSATVVHLSVALGAQLLEVKVELRALKNVAVAAAGLAGPRGDAR